MNLFNDTFSPKVFAESSDKDKIFILFEKIKNNGRSKMIIGAAIYTCSHLVSWNPPASQFKIALSSPNFFEETKTKEIIEFKNADTARPDRIKDVPEVFVEILDNKKTINAANKPPMKEKIGSINIDDPAIPKDIITTAPTAAPEETPIIPGSAIGFLKTPWREAPETAKAEPTSKDNKILGIRILEITFSFTGSTFEESMNDPNK